MKAALRLWLIAGLAISVRAVLRPESHTVLPVYLTAAGHWWADVSLYAEHAPLDFFRYAPSFAVLMTPLAWLGPAVAGIVWGWLNLGLYFWGLRALRRNVLPGDWSDRREGLFFTLALVGALPGLWNGQSNPLLAGLLGLAASALVRHRWCCAAGLLACMLLVKLTLLPVVLLLCALWPARLVPRVGSALVLGLLLPFLTRPPAVVVRQYQHWVQQLVAQSAQRWPGFRDAWTMWIVAQRQVEGKPGLPPLKEPVDASWYRLLQGATGLAVLAVVLRWRGRLPGPLLLTATLALSLAWLMLFGPAIEHPTYALAAPWLAWGFVQRDWSGRPGLVWVAAALVLLLGWGELTRPWHQACPWLILPLPAGMACYLAWLATVRFQTDPGLRKALHPSEQSGALDSICSREYRRGHTRLHPATR